MYNKCQKKDIKVFSILMLGLDDAGKSSILNAMAKENINNIFPTQGIWVI